MPRADNHHVMTSHRRGVALLTVLFVVMAVAVISLGLLARSSTELACGQNMTLRVQMDQLAASGLEHARGLVLNPQRVGDDELDPVDGYWVGAAGRQLDTDSSDFYDVDVHLDGSDPNTRCNYTIQSKAYRLRDGDEVGGSLLLAALRIDPCIALWINAATRIAPGLTIYGDVRCNGSLTNDGSIDGDVFASPLAPTGGDVTGQFNPQSLALAWPSLSVADFSDPLRYSVHSLSSSLVVSDLGPYDPAHVFYRNGDLVVGDGVTIDGMLLVDGDLAIRGNGVTLRAAKNMPAVYATGDLVVEGVDDLTVTGLVAVDGDVRISAAASGFHVSGALLAAGGLVETARDSSSGHHDLVIHSVPVWKPTGGFVNGALEFDGIDDVLEDNLAGAYLNGLNAITVALWVKSDVTNVDRGILFSRDPTGDDEDLGLRYDKDAAGSGGRRVIKASLRATGGWMQIESTSDVQTTSWQHLALVWSSGSALKLYINGMENLLSYTDSRPLSSNPSGVLCGVEKLLLGLGTKGNCWDGLIDDVRIYDQALTGGQILFVKQGWSAGLPNPIAHWRLDADGMDGQITADPAQAALLVWSDDSLVLWSPAVGAFFKTIDRQP